ncbi:Gnt-II system L-idonate transporter [Neolewinella maritima]|uniref:Gnt-II system L-idonate transporter n=1 Tax=Neolewinella maritima TaxID=1383882 RepID=A0ABN8F5Y1_9BACT|nr:gluconate:H+ symporter [Neolewinella maritima]CAH0999540.1 Gnt-II system L-idonate transporter [Neolewinella maritima]
MPLLITLLAVAALLALIVGFKWHPFVALVLVAIATGLGLGMPVTATLESVTSGVGGTLGGLALILGLGAALGGVIAETGAAQVITDELLGDRQDGSVVWGLCLVGFLIGIPLFYAVGFVMMAPIIFASAKKTGLPLAMIAVAAVASLSVTHGFLPPHPAPVLIAGTYGADLGKTLLYGLILAVPAVIIAGPLFARTLRNMPQTSGAAVLDEADLPATLPSFGTSVFCALLPVLLLAGVALLKTVDEDLATASWLLLAGDATVALLLGVVVAMGLLGWQTGQSLRYLMSRVGRQLAPMAAVLLIIAAGGAFKQVLVDSGTSTYIVTTLENFNAHPLVIAWLIAAALRITLGSATVAAITAAGIVLPLASGGGVSPELLVLATGAGSLTCSHVNDTGFWLFKEYFGLTVTQTLRSWTVMETLVSVIGLLGCLGLELLIG